MFTLFQIAVIAVLASLPMIFGIPGLIASVLLAVSFEWRL